MQTLDLCFLLLKMYAWLSVLLYNCSPVPDLNLKSKPVLRRGPAGEDANSRKSLFEVPIIDLNKTLLSLC